MLQRGRKQANRLPGETDRRLYLDKLRAAADHGDVNAMGWLVFLSKVKVNKSHDTPIAN